MSLKILHRPVRSMVAAMAFGGLFSGNVLAAGVQVMPDEDVEAAAFDSGSVLDTIIDAQPIENSVGEQPPDVLNTLGDAMYAATPGAGSAGLSLGDPGSGEQDSVALPADMDAPILDTEEPGAGIEPSEYGSSGHPFTTARADTSGNNLSSTYPYRASGKLYFRKIRDGRWWVCSATLIKRGVIVTAAHCVADFGDRTWYRDFVYIPARYGSVAPYGVWSNYDGGAVMTSYFNGTETCYVPGIVCPNDIGVIRFAADRTGRYPGTSAGWLGYGWNGYGFVEPNDVLTQIDQLGYPLTHDNGLIMHKTNSYGYRVSGWSNNTVWGSRQTGGSSGGPLIVNLGSRGVISGTTIGSEAAPNTIVGVTSWLYPNPAVKQLGASAFRSSNIVPLVNAVCAGNHPACQ